MTGRKLAAVAALLLLSSVAADGAPPGIRTPADVVAYLRQIAGRGTVSGEYVGTGDLAPIAAVHAQTGKWLGLIGGDYFLYDQTAATPPITTFNASARAYWDAGGLIVLNLHMPNPTTGGPVYDLSGIDGAGLLRAGTPSHAALMRTLQAVAGGLRDLQRAGVVVILRIYHESGGNWFWWGTGARAGPRLTSEQMVALWRFTHDYFARDQGLHNLVWLFESGQPDVPVKANYPGDTYVDIVGQDVYTSEPGAPAVVAAYRELAGTGKLVCMAEFGPQKGEVGDRDFPEPRLVAALQQAMPQTVFFQQWWDLNAGRTGWGLASVTGVREALSSPWIINRDAIALRR